MINNDLPENPLHIHNRPPAFSASNLSIWSIKAVIKTNTSFLLFFQHLPSNLVDHPGMGVFLKDNDPLAEKARYCCTLLPPKGTIWLIFRSNIRLEGEVVVGSKLEGTSKTLPLSAKCHHTAILIFVVFRSMWRAGSNRPGPSSGLLAH